MSFQDGGPEIVEPEGVETVVPEGVAAETAPTPEPGADVLARFDRLEGMFGELVRRVPPAAPPEATVEEAPEYTAEELLAELEAENFAEDGSITLGGIVDLVKRQTQREHAARDRADAERRAVEYREQKMGALVERYPDLENNPEVQQRVVDATAALAQRVAQSTGVDWRTVAQSPELVERVYLDLYPPAKGDGDGAPAPTPGTPAVPLERPSGAGGASTTTATPDEGDLIVQRAQAGHRVGKG